MDKSLLIILIFIVTLSIFAIGSIFYSQNSLKENYEIYQGPIPEGYDEQHFRETGEMITIEKQKVYVETEFGCVPLADEYTDAEWETKQELRELLTMNKLERCN